MEKWTLKHHRDTIRFKETILVVLDEVLCDNV